MTLKYLWNNLVIRSFLLLQFKLAMRILLLNWLACLVYSTYVYVLFLIKPNWIQISFCYTSWQVLGGLKIAQNLWSASHRWKCVQKLTDTYLPKACSSKILGEFEARDKRSICRHKARGFWVEATKVLQSKHKIQAKTLPKLIKLLSHFWWLVEWIFVVNQSLKLLLKHHPLMYLTMFKLLKRRKKWSKQSMRVNWKAISPRQFKLEQQKTLDDKISEQIF